MCAAAFLLLIAPAAGADGLGGAVTDDDGIDYGALTGGSSGGSSASPTNSGSRSGPVCTYTLMGGPEGFPVSDVDGNLIEVTAGGAWYTKICDGTFYGAVYLTGPPDAVDPAAVAAGVLERMTIPLPAVGLSPNRDQVVNLPSWFWVSNWSALTGTATVGGVTVIVTAQPRTARWTFGDGETSACAPGIAWKIGADSAKACTHTWKRSSASQRGETFPFNVTVTWDASFSVIGGGGGGPLAPLTRTSASAVRVSEVQAINERAGA